MTFKIHIDITLIYFQHILLKLQIKYLNTRTKHSAALAEIKIITTADYLLQGYKRHNFKVILTYHKSLL